MLFSSEERLIHTQARNTVYSLVFSPGYILEPPSGELLEILMPNSPHPRPHSPALTEVVGGARANYPYTLQSQLGTTGPVCAGARPATPWILDFLLHHL